MNMKTYLFAAALLQAAANAQQIPPPAHTQNDIFNDDEDRYELGLGLDELLEASSAADITQRGYFRSDDYQLNQTAEQKLAQLWQLLVPDASNHSVPVKEHMWKEFDNFFTMKSNGVFCDQSDELRKNRPKSTHTQGLVAKIEWKPVRDESGATRFSGIYEEGSKTAILRLSEAKNLTSQSEGLLPSFAIKFLIDHHKSENLFAMPNMTGKYRDAATQEEYSSWDFFHGTFKNRVEPFQDQCHIDSLERKFLEANNRPYATSVTRPAFWRTKEVQADGSVATVPHYTPATRQEMKDPSMFQFPFQLEYEYEGDHIFPNDREVAWYDRLRHHFNGLCNDTGDGHCETGVPLMSVYAWTAPEGQDDLNGNPRGERVKIATIELQTNLYTSEQGDNRLFFQHIRVNNDYWSFPKEWKKINRQGSDIPDFHRARLPEEVHNDFPAFEGLNHKTDDVEGGNWPWPSNDADAEAKYTELINDQSTGGCPFSWLF